MTIEVPAWAGEAARGLARPLLFATVSGAHLYGFASVDSDLDLRGAHLLAAKREAEHGPLPAGAAAHLAAGVPRLRAALEAAREASHLPDRPAPAAVDALHDLVVRTRLQPNQVIA
ncbi:DNA polymerase beta superfamily protein [Dactylosporangium sp. NPDC000521]|uniref:DNA polymerase beta superfamily protein n=1 Tax=Dactylosporangium sp. NPDC000521 TaxID=3363975 RepID=UPI003693C0E1